MGWFPVKLVLPLYYSLAIGGLIGVFAGFDASPVAATAVWLALVFGLSGGIVLLEFVVARHLATRAHPSQDETRYFRAVADKLTSGYGLGERIVFLTQAGACWFVCGIATVVGASWFGAYLLEHLAFLRPAADAVGEIPVVVRMAVAFLIVDGWSYTRHRIEHAGGETGVLWRLIHKRHHVATECNIWTGMAVSPLEAFLNFAPTCTLLASLGLPTWQLLWLFTIFLIITMPQHMNIGWSNAIVGAVLQGPDAHVRHHASDRATRNTNFADCLTLWDRLFGTYSRPPREAFTGPFGVEREARS